MYKGLKLELKYVVEDLNPGDEIVLSLHWPESYPEFTRRRGTIEEKTDSYISLKMKWGLLGQLERFKSRLLRITPAYKDVVNYDYDEISGIKVVK